MPTQFHLYVFSCANRSMRVMGGIRIHLGIRQVQKLVINARKNKCTREPLSLGVIFTDSFAACVCVCPLDMRLAGMCAVITFTLKR